MLSAAPQAPQKHFTDEELKQQYGIHLATRLQADADGKEAKWADIDDDEDDWAPDTIEWNDGTKITLSHNDPAAALAEEKAAAAAEKARQAEQNRARMPPPKPTTSVGPNAKVLKLGAGGPPKQIGGANAPKISSDKPTLVAKPIPPAPVKSPWAPLPPVDKVTPVAINPPVQSTPRMLPGDNQNTEPSPAPTPPITAMEIAADSFTRTPRENQGGTQGQLYNSQSGQYEPVTSGRRGSVRKDQNFRPPAVLQRPSQIDQRPAEPSAAFQTQRSGSQQEPNRWDRRTSSNVSGGSGLRGRRDSISKSLGDISQQHVDPQPLESPRTPALTHVHPRQDSQAQLRIQQALQSPGLAKLQQLNNVGSAASSPKPGQAQLADGATALQTTIDLNAESERQRQVMKEKRELAIKRKKEEEEKEEAAKRERIRIKMEQLGLAPLEKKEPEKKPGEVKQVVKREVNQELLEPLQESATHATPQSPPKPPVPDASQGTRQYGMMKLHGPSLTNGVPENVDQPREELQNAPIPSQRLSPAKTELPPLANEQVPSPMTNGDVPKSLQRSPAVPGSPESRDQHPIQSQRQRPWNNVPRDPNAFTAWNGGGMTTHTAPTGNLWGPPSNHKALGNGVFDGNVPRPPSTHTHYQEHYSQPTPQPIGPPRSSQRPREFPESGRTSHTKTSPLTENFQTMPSYPSEEGPAAKIIRGEPSDHRKQSVTVSEAAVTMPPPPQISPERLPLDAGQQRSSLTAWGNFHSTSIKEEAEKRRLATQEHAARLAEEARTGVRYEPQLPVMNETWRQVKVDNEDGQRRVVAVAKGANIPDGPAPHHDIRMLPFANQSHMAPPAGPTRGSRFFPTGGQGFQSQQRAASYTMGYNRSPSPPPPDSMQHPAYARSQHHPLVNLPITKPKPTVRLPPALTTAPSMPMMADVHVAPLRAVSQPLIQNPSWQDRFNGLLGVKKHYISPEKKFAEVAGFSETKLPLELPPVHVAAAVSLPSRVADAVTAEAHEAVASKSVEDEEALFEEREFGSLPTVLLPATPPKVKFQKNRKGFSKLVKDPRPVQDVMSKEILELRLEDKENDDPNGYALFINFKGMPYPKKKIMPRLNVSSTSPSVRGNRNTSGNNKGGRGPKSRGVSGNFANQKPAQSGQRVPTQSGSEAHGKGPWAKNWARSPIV